MGKLNSLILWEGNSAIDREPIVVVATGVLGPRGGGASDNKKTGKMTQIWIMPRAASPMNAIMDGRDRSVCGDCQLRPLLAQQAGKKLAGMDREVCYLISQIRAARGPAVVWRTYLRGRYPHAVTKDIPRLVSNPNGVRWGAWGDPLAVPMEHLKQDSILSPLTTIRHTGYTHRWHDLAGQDEAWAQSWLMASVDSEAEAKIAWSRGWRTFRVLDRVADHKLKGREISCPASKEAGNKSTCAKCNLCRGNAPGQRVIPSITIVKH